MYARFSTENQWTAPNGAMKDDDRVFGWIENKMTKRGWVITGPEICRFIWEFKVNVLYCIALYCIFTFI